jgi:hypothetical protein
MSNPVYTIKGLIEIEELEISDLVETFHNCRKITTEYKHKGEVVRKDVAASMLRGPDGAQSVQGKMS